MAGRRKRGTAKGMLGGGAEVRHESGMRRLTLIIVSSLWLGCDDATSKSDFVLPVEGELTPEAVGDLDVFLTGQEVGGSTEDLAFDPRPGGRGLVMGADGRLFAVAPDGAATIIETTGEDLSRVLGMAFDRDGRLYVADPGRKALMRVETDGEVVMVADGDGAEPFESPNDVTVGPDGAVFLSDTCTGKFYAMSADGVIVDRVGLDPAVDGGPNGVVVGPDGALWVTTENTALFCGDAVGLVDPLGGLYRIPVRDDGTFGPVETVARGVGVFGDGLVFDRVGNLYVIFDTVKDFALDETVVFARPHEGGELRRVLSARGKVWANLAFPPKESGADYGPTRLYLSRLAVPPFVPIETRGLDRVELGIGAE